MTYKVVDNGWSERLNTDSLTDAVDIAEKMIADYRKDAFIDGEWNDEVENISIYKNGKKIGGSKKIVIASRPDEKDMDDEGYCENGYCWDHDNYDEIDEYEIEVKEH